MRCTNDKWALGYYDESQIKKHLSPSRCLRNTVEPRHYSSDSTAPLIPCCAVCESSIVCRSRRSVKICRHGAGQHGRSYSLINTESTWRWCRSAPPPRSLTLTVMARRAAGGRMKWLSWHPRHSDSQLSSCVLRRVSRPGHIVVWIQGGTLRPRLPSGGWW